MLTHATRIDNTDLIHGFMTRKEVETRAKVLKDIALGHDKLISVPRGCGVDLSFMDYSKAITKFTEKALGMSKFNVAQIQIICLLAQSSCTFRCFGSDSTGLPIEQVHCNCRDLVRRGMIEVSEAASYTDGNCDPLTPPVRLTDKGKFFVEMLKGTPEPTKTAPKYIDPRTGNEI